MDLKNITWTNETYKAFLKYLQSISEVSYQKFNSSIISTKYQMLGIRIPILRKLAKSISKGNYQSFLNLKSNYYEIIMLQGLVISSLTNKEEFIDYFNAYLPLIDNWALCDTFCNSLKIVSENQAYFKNIITKLINSSQEYYVRVGLVLLLNYYVEESYLDFIFTSIAKTNSSSYYVNMARAWLICECFIKYESPTLTYLSRKNLDKFTQNKAISKIRDSYRVSKTMKEYLLTLKL